MLSRSSKTISVIQVAMMTDDSVIDLYCTHDFNNPMDEAVAEVAFPRAEKLLVGCLNTFVGSKFLL